MGRSEELWGVIEQQIADENLISADQIENIRESILSSRVTVDDWTIVIENTLLKVDDDGK